MHSAHRPRAAFTFRACAATVAACLLLLAAAPLRAAPVPTAAELFSQGYKEFYALDKDAKRSASREEWNKVSARFEEIIKRYPRSGYAPKALFYTARVGEALGERSGRSQDFQQAVETYARFVRSYPRHGWADDCLYRSAEIRITKLSDVNKGREDLETLLKRHPKGDKAAKARKLLAGIPASRPEARPEARPEDKPHPVRAEKSENRPKATQASAASRPAKPEPRPAPASAAKAVEAEPETPAHESPAAIKGRPAGSGKAVLGGIRYTSSDDYTRVVLELSSEVKYRYQLLAPNAEAKRPHRLYVDLADTAVGRQVDPQLQVSDGILRSIRSGQKDPDTARVVIDFLDLQEYKVFPLSDPFRLVIDVYAPDKGEAAKAPQQVASSRNAPEPEPVEEPEPETTPPPRKGKAAKSPIKPLKLKASKSMAGNLIEQLGLTIDTIMIDPGHGGHDGGAVANGIREKDQNLEVARLLGRELKERGFHVLYTRTTDIFIPLEKRTAMANAKKADIFISLHCNANTDARVQGLEIYTLNLARTEDAVRVAARENAVDAKRISDLQFILTDLMLNSKMKESTDLAKGVMRAAVQCTKAGNCPVRDHGVREAPFYVLMGAKMPAVLVEMGFITNREEAARMKSDTFKRHLVQGIVEGVMAYKHQIERYARL